MTADYADLRTRIADRRDAESSLGITMRLLVPFAMLEIIRAGGPSAIDWDWLSHPDRQCLVYEGDRLLAGQAPELVGDLIRSTALLAFVPGGITLFGAHYNAGRLAGDAVSPSWLAPHCMSTLTNDQVAEG